MLPAVAGFPFEQAIPTMDRLSRLQRSQLMAAVKAKNTSPERIVRSLVHSLGLRFRLHQKRLPGSPDLVLSRHRTVILVHGCFWHAHNCRHGRKEPRSNVLYWRHKRRTNRARDRRTNAKLRSLGWQVLIIWECQTRRSAALRDRLTLLLEGLRRRR
jgi:DNA mismatch endonuclease (patch repair protein)